MSAWKSLPHEPQQAVLRTASPKDGSCSAARLTCRSAARYRGNERRVFAATLPNWASPSGTPFLPMVMSAACSCSRRQPPSAIRSTWTTRCTGHFRRRPGNLVAVPQPDSVQHKGGRPEGAAKTSLPISERRRFPQHNAGITCWRVPKSAWSAMMSPSCVFLGTVAVELLDR